MRASNDLLSTKMYTKETQQKKVDMWADESFLLPLDTMKQQNGWQW
jgi:hypothetical protein